jgi:hypothetical protein
VAVAFMASTAVLALAEERRPRQPMRA